MKNQRFRFRHDLNWGDNTVSVLDVADPTDPVALTTPSVGALPYSVFVNGRYVYVANSGDGTVSLLQVQGLDTSSLLAHSAEFGTLDVGESANVSNQLTVGGALTVGSGNIYDRGGLSVGATNGTSILNGNVSFANELTNDSLESSIPGILSTPFVGGGPNSISGTGTIVYVTTNSGDQLVTIDVSDPRNPVVVANPAMGNGGQHIFIYGNVAYALNSADGTVSIFDVTNPAAPSLLTTQSVGTSPIHANVTGTDMFVTNAGDDDLAVFDVTNPASPTPVTTFSTGLGSVPTGLVLQGNLAYVTDNGTDDLQIIDITAPAVPVSLSTTSVGAGKAPYSVAVAGNYAYVVGNQSNDVTVLDVSNPSAPIIVTTVPTGSTPSNIFINGNRFYVTNQFSNDMSIYDITDPASPVLVGTPHVGGFPFDVFAKGEYQYVTLNSDDAIAILGPATLDSHLETTALDAQSAKFNSLSSEGNADVSGLLTVENSVSAGVNGIYSQGLVSILASSTALSAASIFDSASNTAPVLDVQGGCDNGMATGTNGLILAGNMTDQRKFTVTCSGNVFADGSYGSPAADFAEYFHLANGMTRQDVAPGSVMSISADATSSNATSSIEQAISRVSNRTLGVISSDPAFVGNGSQEYRNDPSYIVVGLLGQLPTKVSTMNGAIAAGDPLAPSPIPGVAMKATGSGYIIGTAQQSYDSPDQGLIQVYVRPSWQDGDMNASGTVMSTSTSFAPTELKGLAVIRAGDKEVHVGFASMGAYPMVSIQAIGEVDGGAWLSNITDTGFTIQMDAPLSTDLIFAWTADSAHAGESVYYSDNTTAPYDPMTGNPVGPILPDQPGQTSSTSSTVSTPSLSVPGDSSSTSLGGSSTSTPSVSSPSDATSTPPTTSSSSTSP